MELLHWLCNVKVIANKNETVADNISVTVVMQKLGYYEYRIKKINRIMSRKLAVMLSLGLKIITILCIIKIFTNLFVDFKEVLSPVYEFRIKNLLFLPFEFGICVVVHEMGHYISAKRYNCAIKNIEINIIGLKGKTNIINIEKLSCIRKIDVYFSGIIANIELWIILKAISNVGNIFWRSRYREMGCVCLALIILNLIPLGATDGTEIISLVRNWKNDKFYKNGKC